MIIREAKVEDAEGISRVHVDCWRTTYKNILPKTYLDSLSYAQRTEIWKKNITNAGNHVFVAENSKGEIVGFADGGKRETNTLKDTGDLTSIYILEQWQGQGIGTGLIKQLFLQFKKLGYETIFVEVLEDNKSRFFYEEMGAKFYKSEKMNIGGKELNLLVYRWNGLNSILSH
ncbi:N-acetyltransferase family protein [Cytobacillus praedii]|uniref:GNAT family N-acetyltransferase n=1 Tax=Cytobacillus praedii TaxID=1742358 RepID=UPI003AF57CFC